jgi:3-methylcrotonyl-CoA carboxylase alpha subunit
MPSTGKLGRIDWPEGPRRRYEFGFDSGDKITSYYDPMIAKVIVWDESRPRAIEKMIRTLKDSTVFGVHTNIPYLIEILDHEEFRSGKMTTRFIETYFAEGLKSKSSDDQVRKWGQAIYKQLLKQGSGAAFTSTMHNTSAPSPWSSYWRGV